MYMCRLSQFKFDYCEKYVIDSALQNYRLPWFLLRCLRRPELEAKEDFVARNGGVSSCWFGSMKRRFTAETLQISKVSESLLAA